MKTLLPRYVCLTFVVAIVVTACKSQPAPTDASSAERDITAQLPSGSSTSEVNAYLEKRKISVERDIRAHLPIGSSKAEVDAYLDKREICHSWLLSADQIPGNPAFDPSTGLPTPDCPTEEGVIDNPWNYFSFIEEVIVIEFKFDATKSKMVGFSVRRESGRTRL
jgi:hypothetical protein